jgi:predicted ATPase
MPQLRRTFRDIPPAMALPPDRTRRMLLSAVALVLSRMAAKSPLLLVVDDLHWADEGTLSVLNHIGRALAQRPIMIVGTYRDNELILKSRLAQVLEELTRNNLLSYVRLNGLPESAVREMMEALSGRAVPPQLVKLVFVDTEGNPFFVEELFRHLMERGKLLGVRPRNIAG